MRTDDLIIGTDYLYQTHAHTRGRRVRILETNVSFVNHVERPGSPRLHPVRHQNGVRVLLLNEDGGIFLKDDGTEREEVTFPRRITRTWAEELAQRVWCRAVEDEELQRRQARRQQLAEPIALIRELTGVEVDRRPGGGAHLSDEDLMRIAGALEGLAATAVA